MPAELTTEGLSTQTFAEIRAEIVSDLVAIFGPSINTLPSTILGQLVDIWSELESIEMMDPTVFPDVVVAAIARRTTDKVPDDIEVISKTNGVSWVVGRVYNSTKDCKFDTEYLRRCTEEAFPSTVGSNSCKLHWHRYRTTWGKMSNKWTLFEKSMDTQVEFSVCSPWTLFFAATAWIV